jgi:hypothetical protein
MSRFASVRPQIFRPKPLVRIFKKLRFWIFLKMPTSEVQSIGMSGFHLLCKR